jgi:hypothetical protein
MLLYHIDWLCKGILGLMLFAWVCAAYAYFINARRLSDDLEKKDFLLAAVFLAPITFIPFLACFVLLLIARAIVYGASLFVSILLLIVFRKWFFLVWLHKALTYVGDKLLEANTFLIRLFLRPWSNEPEAI